MAWRDLCDQRCAQRLAHGDVRLAAEVDVTDLVFADVKVGPVDLALVAEQPVRARVYVGPTGERFRDRLRVLGEARGLGEAAFAGEFHGLV